MSSSSDDEIILNKRRNTNQRASNRSRLPRNSETVSKALKEIKEARLSGKFRRIDVDSLIKPVYEEVDEREYLNIKRQRQNDCFVVDDDGNGYIDDGDDFSSENEYLDDVPLKQKEGLNSMLSFEEEDLRELLRWNENFYRLFFAERHKKNSIRSYFSDVAPKNIKDENSISLRNDPEMVSMLNQFFDNQLEFDPEECGVQSSNPYLRNPFKRELSRPSEDISPTPVKIAKISSPDKMLDDKKAIVNSEALEFGRKYGQKENFCVNSEHNNIILDDNNSAQSDGKNSLSLHSRDLFIEARIHHPLDKNVKYDLKTVTGDSETNHGSICSIFVPDDDNDILEVEVGAEGPFNENSNDKTVLRFYWLDTFEDTSKNPGICFSFLFPLHFISV
ncbi:unnamed protein product [Dracunculus medinensis]|uniref:DNA_pol_alpha_N domain-containing protein n=1 Tax=Dracunculus medinensis TaxID=318479 RepID=A0A0N4UQ97_DRAME|nr:unnamed protein product [Dracunculus medinensis]